MNASSEGEPARAALQGSEVAHNFTTAFTDSSKGSLCVHICYSRGGPTSDDEFQFPLFKHKIVSSNQSADPGSFSLQAKIAPI